MNSPHVNMHNASVTETTRLALGKRSMHSFILNEIFSYNCDSCISISCAEWMTMWCLTNKRGLWCGYHSNGQ